MAIWNNFPWVDSHNLNLAYTNQKEGYEMILKNETYDKLKPYAMWILSLTALLMEHAELFNFPYGNIVVKVITAINVILGLVLQDSTRRYNRTKVTEEG